MRVTNMAGVDLETYRFDYDLTFTALLMNADGTIYHTYGGRTWENAQSHLSERAFADVLSRTLVEHAAYEEHPEPPRRGPARTIEDLPPALRRIRNDEAPECYHCHMVNDFVTEELREQGQFELQNAFRWPDPIQLGLSLAQDDQAVVAAVAADSAAAAIDLRAGDRLSSISGQGILTFGDVQRALEEAHAGRTTLELLWKRNGEARQAWLTLPADWKEPTPMVFSWRASKWPLSPKPGFGGPQLTAAQLERHGLAAGAFAFRINYFVTWGPAANTGRNATQAGLRKEDVVVSLDGKDDFVSVEHFHSWFRLTREVGRTVAVVILRDGERATIELPVLP